MLNKTYVLTLGLAAAIGFAQASFGETRDPSDPSRACGKRDEIVANLEAKYHESRRMVALSANNSVLEIFAAEAGNWTIIVTPADGVSCLIASGEAFEELDGKFPHKDAAL